MFKQFFEVFWPKAKEYIAEQGLNNALDFDHTLKELQDNLKLLRTIAFEVEEEIKNAEDSRQKNRKREAQAWLEGVKSMILKVEELGREAESKGFIMRFLGGGKATQLNADIVRLFQLRLDFGEPVLDSRGTTEEIVLLTNGMVGEAFIENPEWDRQVSQTPPSLQTPMAPSPSQTPPSLQTPPMAPSPSQTSPSLLMQTAPSTSQTPPSPPPLMEFLKYVVPTMLIFLAMQYGAKPKALLGKHRMPLGCFFATTSIYWLTVEVMKQMVLTTKASQMCYLVLSQIALASRIQSLLFLLSLFLNHVPPTMISLFISAPIALIIAYLFIKMVFGDRERNSTDQPVRSPV